MLTAAWSCRCVCTAILAAAVAGGCARENPVGHRIAGDNALEGGRFGEAIVELNRALDIQPGDLETRYRLGQAYMGAGEYNQAAEAFRLCYIAQPQTAEYLDSLADAMLAAGKSDELFRLLRTNAAERGGVEDHLRLGRNALKMGDADTARSALITAARVDKGQTAGPQIALHDFYKFIKDERAADERLRMAFFADPRSTEVRSRMIAAGVVNERSFGRIPLERRQWLEDAQNAQPPSRGAAQPATPG